MAAVTRVGVKGLPGVRPVLVGALVLAAVILVSVGSAEAKTQEASTATAQLQDNEGNPAGTAQFVETPQGVEIAMNLTGGVEPGVHGLHIHETGDLSSSDFKSAGDHFNPTDAEHGFNNPRGPHAGDLKNITVAEDGTATYQTVNERITLSEGPNSILDEDGSALVVHEMSDDQRTNDNPQSGPGTSGNRVVAGVIEAGSSEQPLPDTGGPSIALVSAALLMGGGILGLIALRRRTE